MANSLYRVKHSHDGMWVVFEAGKMAALSAFDEKCDAVEYAFSLARSSRGATVEIRNRHDRTEASGELAMGIGRTDD